MVSAKKNKKHLKKVLTALLIILVLCCLGYFLIFRHHSKVKVQGPIKTTIHSLSSTPTGTNSTNKTPQSSSVNTQGTSTSLNGQQNSSPPQSEWTTSQSGLLTVEQPGDNSLLSSGFVLSGTNSLSQVQYTLIDDQVGVISQGFINVVNGNFSASISFTATSATGRLDVFNSSSNGEEINEVQIPVRF
jgi:cytoskeletal protein RodZ